MQRTGIIGMKTYERRVNMVISATELKMNLGYYLELSEREDIHITKNGKTVAKLVRDEPSVVMQMSGLLAKRTGNVEHKKMKGDRLAEKYLGKTL